MVRMVSYMVGFIGIPNFKIYDLELSYKRSYPYKRNNEVTTEMKYLVEVQYYGQKETEIYEAFKPKLVSDLARDLNLTPVEIEKLLDKSDIDHPVEVRQKYCAWKEK